MRKLLTRHTVHPPEPVCLPTTRVAEGLLTAMAHSPGPGPGPGPGTGPGPGPGPGPGTAQAMAHSPGQLAPGLDQGTTAPHQTTNVLEQPEIGEICPKTDLPVILTVLPFLVDSDGDSASIYDNFSITNNHGSLESLSFSSRGNSSVYWTY